MSTKDKSESDEEPGFLKSLFSGQPKQADDDDDDNNNDNDGEIKKPPKVNNEASQQYYDPETGGDEIVAVETDQDKANSKPRTAHSSTNSKSRSNPTSPSPSNIDCSACCDTTGKKWAWCGLFIVVLTVGIVLLAVSLKKLNSTEVSILLAGR
jgi:hypothetical protein